MRRNECWFMAGEKLIRFYRTKLSNYNLIYSFMMTNICFFGLLMILFIALPLAFGLAFGMNGLWFGLLVYAILFFALLLHRDCSQSKENTLEKLSFARVQEVTHVKIMPITKLFSKKWICNIRGTSYIAKSSRRRSCFWDKKMSRSKISRHCSLC